MSDFEWNDETNNKLRELWASGLSTSKIGERLGCSKKAVVSKARRLNLEARPNPILVRGSGKKPRSERVKKPGVPTLVPLQSVVVAKPAEHAVIPQTKVVTIKPARIVSYRGEPCCWPMSPCENLAVRGKPYCADHCDRAYVGAPVSKNTSFNWTRPDRFRIAR